MKGRKPLPSGVKGLFGNPGKRRLNEQEPKPAIGLPDPPHELDDQAKAIWDRVGEQLVQLGVMTVIDANALARYCTLYSHYLRTEKLLRDWTKDGTGPVIMTGGKDGKAGTLMVHPFHTALLQYGKELRQLESEFGLTPASRTRIKVDTGMRSPVGNSDPFAAMLN